jgi:hypothetical protein
MIDAYTILVGTNVDDDKAMRKVTSDLRPGIKEMTKGHKAGDVLAKLDVDPYYRSFRNSCTHVFAAKLDEPSIRAALHAGHAYVSHDWMGDATGFTFDAVAANGDRLGMMGDQIKRADGMKLVAKLPLPAYLRLIRNGKEVANAETAADWNFAVKESGVYRLEAWLKLDGEHRPWILSNPFYVK